jgi:hypothetical protein
MTESTGLEWLTEGAQVAHVSGESGRESVYPATVTRIGKRDVTVTVNDRVEKFNVSRTWTHGEAVWLHRRPSAGSWARGVELAPWDDPQVVEYRRTQTVRRAVFAVRDAGDKFAARSGVDTARELRSAVNAFLKLAEDA